MSKLRDLRSCFHDDAGLTTKGTCSYCSNRKVLDGFNDVACLKPDLLKEWNDPRDPHLFVFGSNTKISWKCANEHEWSASIKIRFMGAGCRKCSWIDNTIIRKREKRILLKDASPELAFELVDQSLLNIISFSSHKVVQWRCSKGHIYDLSVNYRQSGRGCSYCSNRKVLIGYNDISSHPDVARELVDKTLASTPEWSRQPLLWEHTTSAGVLHRWHQAPQSKISGVGCLICAAKIVIPGINDVATTHPEIAEQWGPGNSLAPTEVTYGSKVVINFICEKGHNWHAAVKSATSSNSVCQDCKPTNEHFRSKGEGEVLAFLEESFPDLVFESNVRRFRKNDLYELDIFQKDLKIAVDFNGVYYHQEKFKGADYHANKQFAAAVLGLVLLEVWEDHWQTRRKEVEKGLISAFRGGHINKILKSRPEFS